jgi:hypothetical protein
MIDAQTIHIASTSDPHFSRDQPVRYPPSAAIRPLFKTVTRAAKCTRLPGQIRYRSVILTWASYKNQTLNCPPTWCGVGT